MDAILTTFRNTDPPHVANLYELFFVSPSTISQNMKSILEKFLGKNLSLSPLLAALAIKLTKFVIAFKTLRGLGYSFQCHAFKVYMESV